MFRICFVWVYIIKGFLPLNKGKANFSLRGVCRPWRANSPFVKLASIGRLCKRTNVRLWEKFSLLPEVVLHKRKQNGLFRVLLSYNFLRQYAVLSLLGSGRLEMTDQRFKWARQRSKTWFGDRSILWYKFLGATLLQLHIRIINPCGVETL